MPVPAEKPNPAALIAAKYVGNYLFSCARSGNGTMSVRSLSFEEDIVTQTTQEYSDEACMQPGTRIDIIASINYPGESTNTTLGAADHINITPEEILIDGGGFPPELFPQAQADGLFDRSYNIILLDEAMLYMGEVTDINDGSSEAMRPTDLDSVPGIRQ